MSKINALVKSITGRRVSAQIDSNADESKEGGSGRVQPTAERTKVRSRRVIDVADQPVSQGKGDRTTIDIGASRAPGRADRVTPAKASKQDAVLELLRRDDGATIDELIEATNWQAHSVRGFLSGTVRKRLKINLISDLVGNGIRRYRVGASDEGDAAQAADQSAQDSLPPAIAITQVALSEGVI